MQEFFMDYGLWLLVGLLIVIALVFLLSGKRKGEELIEPVVPVEPAIPPAPIPFVDPIIAAPVAPAPPVAEPAVLVEPTPAPTPPIAKHVAPIEPAPAPQPVVQPAAVAPEPEPAPTPTAPVAADSDDLLRLKGVGPKLKTLLIDLGVTRYAQIAAWTDADIAAIDAKLGSFKGRPVRDQWIDQAKYLAADDIAGFEAKYGKL